MSLIAFHKFLISTAILFSLGFAIRQLSEFGAAGDTWALIAAIVLGTVAAALGYYLAHLRDFLRLPPRGTGSETSGDAGGRSGNGRQPPWPGPSSRGKPEIPPMEDNGYHEQEHDELREHSKR